ncbi:MAG TPA: BBP7 family outer membrane beta-barrel protein, partial [Gemmatales bacterium]|nr:BBP7 family outer membrane beta-barrel protein [Gemmatales bacterium]
FFDSRYIIDPITGFQGESTSVLLGDYAAHNQFYGGQVGLRFDSDFGRFFVNGFGKFGFGSMRQDLSVIETVFNVDGAEIPFAVYPSPTVTNETRNRLAFVLEGNLSAGFFLTDNIMISAGYNVIVMTRVARPSGASLPARGAGSVTLASEERPLPVTNVFSETRYYAHGLTLGLEFRY